MQHKENTFISSRAPSAYALFSPWLPMPPPLFLHSPSLCVSFLSPLWRAAVCLFESLLHHTCLFKLQMTLETKRACLRRLPRYSPRLPTTQDSLNLAPFFFTPASPRLSPLLALWTGKWTTPSLGNNSYKYSRALNTPRAPQLSPVDNTR